MPLRDFNLIQRIGEIIANISDYQEALRLTVRCVAAHLKVDACSILVQDNERNELVLAATYGMDQKQVGRLRLSNSEGITGYSFRHKDIVNTAEMQKHPLYRSFAGEQENEYSALLSIPLMAGGLVIGVMNLARRKPVAFNAATVALGKAVAAPLAIFLANAKMAQHLDAEMPEVQDKPGGRMVLKGIAVSRGVVRGKAYLVTDSFELEHIQLEYVEDREAEKRLFTKALELSREDTVKLQKQAGKILAEADSAIFLAHLLLLEDPILVRRVNDCLELGYSLRYALHVVANQFKEELEKLDNELMRERVADMKDVIMRILQAIDRLKGEKRGRRSKSAKIAEVSRPIVVARELLPSELMRLPLAKLVGIVCEHGGTTTHVAILAKALGLPTIVGVPNATAVIRNNDELILDCTTGFCHVRPPVDIIKKFRHALRFHRTPPAEDKEMPAVPAVTADGTELRLGANISLVSELPLIKRYGALGIGLYRTEFMFMIRSNYPTEEEQYNVFTRVVDACGGHSATFRVLDIGGDKPLPYVNFEREDNPFLGWRGLRFLFDNQQYMEPHLRAILRAARHGRVNILLPMVSDYGEFMQARDVLDRMLAELRRIGVCDEVKYRIGIMAEVPALLWGLPDILPHIDFVSIGTNDLIQYSFAVDRGNSKVSRYFRQFHPTVLKMIKHVCDLTLSMPNKTVSLCGEAAGTALGLPFLLGAGLRYLSMNPWRIPNIRKTAGKLKIPECRDLLDTALGMKMNSDVWALMNEFAVAKKIIQPGEPNKDYKAE